MCSNFTILKQTENGMLVLFKGCEQYQLTFKNLNFNLTPLELDSFITYLKNIDIDYWEKEYINSIYERKIPIPTLQSNLMILMNRFEIDELLVLINFEFNIQFLNYKDISSHIIWN